MPGDLIGLLSDRLLRRKVSVLGDPVVNVWLDKLPVFNVNWFLSFCLECVSTFSIAGERTGLLSDRDLGRKCVIGTTRSSSSKHGLLSLLEKWCDRPYEMPACRNLLCKLLEDEWPWLCELWCELCEWVWVWECVWLWCPQEQLECSSVFSEHCD